MMRGILFAFALFLVVIVPSSRSFILRPLPIAPFNVHATPVPLNENDPRQTMLGSLNYLGGWSLTSDSPSFGGLSALAIDQGSFLGLGDEGSLIRFTLDRGEIRALPIGCGIRGLKDEQDSESLVIDHKAGLIRVGLEGRNSICIFRQGSLSAVEIRPSAMKSWRPNKGPEAMAQLGNGGLLVFAEEHPNKKIKDRLPLLFYPAAPVDRDLPAIQVNYRPPTGMNPTDAVALRDGRVLVLNRSYAFPASFTAALVIIDKPDYRPGAVWQGREIARFAPPIITDNMEGLAVEETPKGVILWITSDNNFLWFERTLLLKFRLEERAGR